MEVTAIISAALKLGVALIPVLFYWLGYSRGKKSGYEKGVQDEAKRCNERINNLAADLYKPSDVTFGVQNPGVWTAPSKADATARMEPSGGSDNSQRSETQGAENNSGG